MGRQDVTRRFALFLSLENESTFRISVYDLLKESVRPARHGLVTILGTNLTIIRNTEKIFDKRHMLAGRIGPLKVLKGRNGFGVIFFHKQPIGRFELGFLSVRVEWVLIQQLLVLIGSSQIVLVGKRAACLLIIFFGRGASEGCRAAPDAHQHEAQAQDRDSFEHCPAR